MPANILNLPQYRVLRVEETDHTDRYGAVSFTSINADHVLALRSKEQAAHDIATAIRKLAQEVKHEVE